MKKHFTFFISCCMFFIPAILSAQCSFTVSTTVTNVTCYNGTNGSIIVNVSGGTAPYQYQLSEAGAGAWQGSNSFTALTASTYPVSVKDATGCITTIYRTVTQPAALTATYVASDATCSGSANGSIAITTSGGTAPYTYSWTKNGAAYSTSQNLTNLGPGNYLLTVTDANACSTSPVVTQQVKPVALTGFNQDVIANGTGAANASTTQPLDDHNYVYYAQGYNNGTTTGSYGLPASGIITSAQSASRTYQLASYTGNNSLVLTTTPTTYGSANSGTLTFTSPYQAPYATLYVIGTTGNGTGTVNYTVNFADATTYTGSISFQDWFLSSATSSSVRAIGSLDRVTWASPGAFDNSTSFNIYEAPISIPGASQSKVINSVAFTWSASGTARINLFGITGYTSTTSGIRINDGAAVTVTPSVTVTTDAPGNTFCSGQPVTFTANPVNGGTSPSYQWKLNGSNIGGATAATYTSNSLANGNQVSVVLTSNLACVSTSTGTSPVVTMSLGTVTAAVASSASSTNICSGTSVTFTATPTNGGALPTYQWKLNGSNIGGATASTYSSSTLNNSDQVSVVMTSSIGCAVSNPATSTATTMTVTTSAAPTVSITSVPAITFSSSITYGGASPTYQWYKNGVAIGGATSSTYFTATGILGDQYAVKMTSNYTCKTAPAAMSNYITVTYGVLAVTLDWFTANAQGNAVLLKWKTAAESDSKQFILQRASAATGVFENIGTVTATGLSNGSTYSFTDNKILNGTWLYRLILEDKNGKTKTLGTQTVTINKGTSWKVLTLNGLWQIQTNQPLQYYLTDDNGRVTDKGTANGTTNIIQPAKGIYFLKVITADGNSTIEKLITH
ncbi:MAG: T9SS type A sorting domain-containing protein [Bacteroidetes bacterium]|nr:T9SS type A sorting domain-containing protein [Bacteroidota bacterium]